MKNIIKTAFLLILALSLTLVIVSCDGGNTAIADDGTYDYVVTVKDGVGAPIKGIIVRLCDTSGKQMDADVTGADGSVSFENVKDSSYKLKLNKGVTGYNFSKTEYDVDATKSGYTITLHNEPKDEMNIYGPAVDDDSKAYVIGEGSYRVDLEADVMTYFVFSVSEDGVYDVGFLSDSSNVDIGYYGIPSYVQDVHCLGDGTEEYDGKGFEIEIPDIATPYTIGIKSSVAQECVFSIQRKSNLPFRPEYVDWTYVDAHAELSSYTLPEGATLEEFDITDRNLKIVVGKNGKYYTEEGNLIVLRLASATQNSLLAYDGFLSLKELAGFSGSSTDGDSAGSVTGPGTVGMYIGGHIYDDEGNFIAKKAYNDMIKTYLDYCDSETGVYPLTEELMDMIKVHGNSAGWWKPGTVNYLFNTNVINEEMAWLFICSYVVEN